MLFGRTTVSKFVIEQLRDLPGQSDLGSLLIDVTAAVKAIAAALSKGALAGRDAPGAPGETRRRLHALTNQAILRHCEWGGQLAGMASEELEAPYPIPSAYPRGRYLLAFDPLDGSAHVDVNASVGTLFSVFAKADSAPAGVADFLRPGREQVAAGYAFYGPSSLLVLTLGKGTHGFTLDREGGNFILTHPHMLVPEEASEFAINTSNERFWEPPVRRYVTECTAGKAGVRGRDFNMRWIASTVAEVHRILVRGGIFMYPRDSKDLANPSRLRLLYEAGPIAMLVEQAGGAASTGRERILDVVPTSLQQRVPVLLGSRNEVERLARYHADYDNGTDQHFRSPLFQKRSLFRSKS
jgi:fructose-1,6-bisphosphatase I/sedoheptulose-1,7-bisphosphatase/fructose-1,6-bisphosphatase I